MMKLITEQKIFGSILCDMYTIECQKRGLPHAHILLWLREKIRPVQIDSFIGAEFPVKNYDPQLYETIKSQMIHGPCGRNNPNSPCMQDNKCSNRFPHILTENTQTNHDGYPLYRRKKPEAGGGNATIKVHVKELVLESKLVVPYNPFRLNLSMLT